MFMVLSYNTSHFESSAGLSNVEQRQAAGDPQTKPTDLLSMKADTDKATLKIQRLDGTARNSYSFFLR